MGNESEKEIQPQLFPLGLVAIATEAFSAERETDIRKSERDNMAILRYCHKVC